MNHVELSKTRLEFLCKSRGGLFARRNATNRYFLQSLKSICRNMVGVQL